MKSVKNVILVLQILLIAGILAGCKDPDVPDADTIEPVVYNSKDNGTKVSFSSVSGLDFVKEFGFGWNLGNTLDATASGLNAGLNTETYWGQPKTTKAMIDGLVAAGIKTIRIPISWHNHIADKDTYEIDEKWLARVKEIVDWAIDDGLYVIINIHHDNAGTSEMKAGNGFSLTDKNKYESEKFLTNVWGQIAATFNNSYDEHLVFETLNEPRLVGDDHEWSYNPGCSDCKKAMDNLNEYNQLIVDTIRKSGGNNKKRFISVPSIACSPDAAFSSDFKLPTDSASDKIIVAVHMYTPYNFAMASPGDVEFTAAHKSSLDYYFNKLDKTFISKGIPVYIGEMGAVNKNNLEDREAWFEYYVGNAMKKGIPSILWDNGSYLVSGTDYNEKFGYYNRKTQEWYFPSLIKIAVKAAAK